MKINSTMDKMFMELLELQGLRALKQLLSVYHTDLHLVFTQILHLQ